jgi:hypothetical protein
MEIIWARDFQHRFFASCGHLQVFMHSCSLIPLFAGPGFNKRLFSNTADGVIV